MNPTLRNADLLEVVPYDDRKIRRGDVITFMPLNAEISITHRIISVDVRGVRTLGDNNSTADPGYIQPDNIIGRVVYAKRNKRQLCVYGGREGRIYAIVIRSIRRIKIRLRTVLILLRPIYLYICRSKTLRKFIPAKTDLKIFSFSRPNGIELHLFWGHRIIGRLAPGASQWHIKVPFRLFIDVDSLPKCRDEVTSPLQNRINT
jgi:signal peptidase I